MKIAAAVAFTAAAAIGLMWWVIQSQVEYERTQAITAATERNDNLAVAFDQFVTRTLQAASTTTEFVRSAVETSGPSVALDLLRKSHLVEGGAFDGVGVLDVYGRLIATFLGGSTSEFTRTQTRSGFS
jgi:two-component system sensor kinase FixL